MFNQIEKVHPYSFSQEQDFMWVAEYLDGSLFFEFDKETKEMNDFRSINKDQLLRFGLVGHGYRFWYDIPSGIIHLNDRMIEVIYKTNDEEYMLTSQPYIYNDLIQYKEAYSTFNPSSRYYNTTSAVMSYNFGYKSKLNIKGVNFNFKAICTIPFGKPVFINFRLVSDKDLNGRLIIKNNGLKVYEYEAPLKANKGGELNWVVR